MNLDEIVEMWRTEIWEYNSIVDPDDKHDWTSLAIGWALGKGYTIKQANVIASRLQAKGLL